MYLSRYTGLHLQTSALLPLALPYIPSDWSTCCVFGSFGHPATPRDLQLSVKCSSCAISVSSITHLPQVQSGSWSALCIAALPTQLLCDQLLHCSHWTMPSSASGSSFQSSSLKLYRLHFPSQPPVHDILPSSFFLPRCSSHSSESSSPFTTLGSL